MVPKWSILGGRVKWGKWDQWSRMASRAKVFRYFGVLEPMSICRYIGIFRYCGIPVVALGATVIDVPAFRYLVYSLGSKISIFWWHWHR